MKCPSIRSASFCLALGLASLPAAAGPSSQVRAAIQAPARPAQDAKPREYTVEDFAYEDPHPPGYHPLGRDSLNLLERGEIFVAQPSRGVSATVAGMLDDADHGYQSVVAGGDLGLSSQLIRATAAGNVDLDASEELIVLQQVPGFDRFLVQIFDNPAVGTTPTRTIAVERPFGEDCVEGRLSVGDVDGDGRDEILVSGRSGYLGEHLVSGWVQVYDDALDGGGLMFETPYGYLSTDVQAVAADVDGDGADEVVMFGENADYGELWILAFDDAAADAPFAQLAPWFRAEQLGSTRAQGRLLAGDFDDDGSDELVVMSVVSRNESGRQRLTLALHQAGFDPTSGFTTAARYYSGRGLHAHDHAADLHRAWDATVRATGPGAPDEIVAVSLAPDGTFSPDGFRWNDSAGTWEVYAAGSNFSASGPLVLTLGSGDVDADGADEVVIANQFAQAGDGVLRGRVLDWHDGGVQTTVLEPTSSGNGHIYPPTLAVGDFDGDGLIIESTGGEQITLADPIPLVLLTAPPTKSGIGQDYGSCATSYKSSTTSEISIGTSSSTAFSFYNGVTTGPLSDFASAELKTTLETTLTENEVATTATTTFRTNAAGHSEDVMVFQGTLYHGYEYEVISASDPDDIGKILIVSIPVGTREYQWSADLYNSVVEDSFRIPGDLRPHTVGDPASYRSLVELDTHRAPYVGWRDNSVATVPQSGTTGLGFALTERQTTSQERSMSVGVDVDFSVGFNAFGGSFSVTDSSLYSVSVEETAEYVGTLGAIGDVSDYFRWQYDAGLCMYHYGVDAATAETLPGVTPFQVVTYWVNAFGSGY